MLRLQSLIIPARAAAHTHRFRNGLSPFQLWQEEEAFSSSRTSLHPRIRFPSRLGARTSQEQSTSRRHSHDTSSYSLSAASRLCLRQRLAGSDQSLQALPRRKGSRQGQKGIGEQEVGRVHCSCCYHSYSLMFVQVVSL